MPAQRVETRLRGRDLQERVTATNHLCVPHTARNPIIGRLGRLLGVLVVILPLRPPATTARSPSDAIPENVLVFARKRSLKEVPACAGAVKNGRDGLRYAWIPPGTFQMGCSPGDRICDADEKPLHQVTISKGFWMGQTEVTVAAYKRFVSMTGRRIVLEQDFKHDWEGDEAKPIVNISWKDAQAYCQWAGGRLPTEAEWEYAARGGNNSARYGPLDEIAWYADNSGQHRLDSNSLWDEDQERYENRLNEDQQQYYKRLIANGDRAHEVAGKRPNALGLYDTLGNVWEWVNDWFDVLYYSHSPNTDPPGAQSGSMRILRGGSYLGPPGYVRVSFRYGVDPALRYSFVGARCALDSGP